MPKVPFNTLAPLRGRMRLGQSMARYCSWRAGGVADMVYEPADQEDLQHFLQGWAKPPVLWIGLGSNVLIRDGGFRGTVVILGQSMSGMERLSDHEVYAECGVSAPRFARFCADLGLAGLEFLAGVPGTIGGALAMNAGAHGSETWRHVMEAEIMTVEGGRKTLTPEDFNVGYRSVTGHGEGCFLGARFRLQADAPEAIKERMDAWLARRAESQPLNLPSCGSVFRNPEGDHAGRLIEVCGLKGIRVGDAKISKKHGNFIINLAKARASEIEALIRLAQWVVGTQKNIALTPEVRILGEYQDV